MTTYAAPMNDMLFAMRELAGLEGIADLPGNEEVSADLVVAILDEAGKFAAEVLAPINSLRRPPGLHLQGWCGDQRRRDSRKPIRVLRQRLACHASAPRLRRAGPAARACRSGGAGDVEVGQHGLLPVPDADDRCRRSHRPSRLGSAAEALPAEDGEGQVDRHHEPDRAAGRFGPVGGAHARPSPRAITIASRAPRSSSPGASTTWRRTSSIWCWPACPMHPKA